MQFLRKSALLAILIKYIKSTGAIKGPFNNTNISVAASQECIVAQELKTIWLFHVFMRGYRQMRHVNR